MSYTKFAVYLLLIANTFFCCKPKPEDNIYNVGFKYYLEYDSTRLYTYRQDTIFRPMLIGFWYPSVEVPVEPNMSFKEYIDLISIQEDYSKSEEAINSETYNFVNAYAQYAQNAFGIGLNVSTQQILESPVKAHLNLPLEKAEFPLIIYAPSNEKSPYQNHVICEYLASHGFYVISVASAGPNSIMRKDLAASILAQVEDMEFLVDYFENKLNLNYSNIGLLGFSTGGLATTIFQMKHPQTKAVFSMDGSHEYSLYLPLTKLDDYDIEKTEISYFLAANQDRQSIYPYFNSIKSKNKIFLRMPQLSHFGFVSFWSYFDSCDPDTVLHDYSGGYQLMCENAYTFFNATLYQNNKSLTKLSSRGLQEKDHGAYETIDYSESTQLLNTFLEQGIDSALLTYKNHKTKALNNYDYTEEEISALGRMLVDYDLDASIKLFQFNQQEYPDSWHAYIDLAFGYKIKGEIDLAKKALIRAKELAPENEEIDELLNDLVDQLQP
jgi:tetratricopeptide (TPR) repeat protein